MQLRKLGRQLDHRESMYSNLATSLVLYERIQTTMPKAKEVRRIVEKWINLGKEGGTSSFRRLLSQVSDTKAAKKIMEELAPRYKDITGGYMTLSALLPRLGDNANMSIVELRSISQAALPKKEIAAKATPNQASKKPGRAKKPKSKK